MYGLSPLAPAPGRGASGLGSAAATASEAAWASVIAASLAAENSTQAVTSIRSGTVGSGF